MKKDMAALISSGITLFIIGIVMMAYADTMIESNNGAILIILSDSPEVFIDGTDTTVTHQSIDENHGRIFGHFNDSNAKFYIIYDIPTHSIKAKFWNYDTNTIHDSLVITPLI